MLFVDRISPESIPVESQNFQFRSPSGFLLYDMMSAWNEISKKDDQ